MQRKLITLAKKGNLAARRSAISLLGNRNIIGFEDGVEVKKGTVIGKLFSDIGPRYLDRPGGYTRIIRLALRRLGDNGQLVLLQLVGSEESAEEPEKTSKKKRSRKEVAVTEKKEESTKIQQENETEDAKMTQESSSSSDVSEDKADNSDQDKSKINNK